MSVKSDRPLGSGQAVRRLTLDQETEGSNPSSPAKPTTCGIRALDHATSCVRGEVWTWVAIDQDSRLIVTWLVGTRGPDAAHEFIADLRSRVSGRVQITTDGYKPYLDVRPSGSAALSRAEA